MEQKTLIDLAKQAWQIYTTQFNFFLIIVMLLAFPLNMVLDFTEAHSFMNDPSIIAAQQNYYNETVDVGLGEYELVDYWGYFKERKMHDSIFWVNVAATILSWMLELIISIAVVLGVSKVLRKQKLDVRETLEESLQYWWPMLITGLIMTVLLIPLYLALIVPGVIFTVYWLFYWQVVVLEKKNYWGALKRSRELVRGKWWEVLGRYGVIILLVSIIGITLASASTTLMKQVPGSLGVVITIIQIISLYTSVFLVVYYFDLKKRATISPLEIKE